MFSTSHFKSSLCIWTWRLSEEDELEDAHPEAQAAWGAEVLLGGLEVQFH